MRRKTLSEHALAGTEPQFSSAEQSCVTGTLPRPPKDLSKDEKKSFRRYVRTLADRRAVSAGDGTLLGILVRTESRCQDAQQKLREEGLTKMFTRLDSSGQSVESERPNLHLKILEVGDRQVVQILVRLGLTPRDRDAVRPTAPMKQKRKAGSSGITFLDESGEEQPFEQTSAPVAETAIDFRTIDETCGGTI